MIPTEPAQKKDSLDTSPFTLEMQQLTFFESPDNSPVHLELYPAVWGATAALTSPDETIRRSGLEQLDRLGAARYAPLVVYVLATRLNEPNLEIRVQVVRLLDQVLQPDAQGKPAPGQVRATLGETLAQMRTRQVYALLQAAENTPEVSRAVAHLLGECSYAGNHLVDIFNNRSLPLWVRKLSIGMCGEVGFLSTLPALERLSTRLEARANGQQSMPFLPKDGSDELELLPVIYRAVEQLNAA